jgi:hypothetical protein|tara:strand:- start:86 stop:1006 length:921 start_codon:yes stop_codon:yes gene_type:complete
MKLFLIKNLKYLLFFFIAYILMFSTSSVLLKTKYSNVFTSFVIDKHKAIATKGNSKRIVLMGGSNTIYSINSSMLEKELEVKVINSGFVYNTGYEFQLNFLKKYTKEGDIVLYIPEFSYYSGNGKHGGNFIFNALLSEPNLVSLLGSQNLINFLKKGSKSTMTPIFNYITNKPILSEIKRSDFNSYGDLIYHLDKKTKLDKVRSYPIVKTIHFSKNFQNDIDELEHNLKEKNVQFFITYPVYAKNFISNKVLRITDSLVAVDDTFIGSLKDNLFDDDMFYDSPFHASNQARHIYTKNLIKYLRNVI